MFMVETCAVGGDLFFVVLSVWFSLDWSQAYCMRRCSWNFDIKTTQTIKEFFPVRLNAHLYALYLKLKASFNG